MQSFEFYGTISLNTGGTVRIKPQILTEWYRTCGFNAAGSDLKIVSCTQLIYRKARANQMK